MTLKRYRVVVDQTQSWTVDVWASSPVGAKGEAIGEVEFNKPEPTQVADYEVVEMEEVSE